MESEKKGLKSKLTAFVPQGEDCEVHNIDLSNKSSERKDIELYSLVKWCLWDAVDDSQNYQRNLNIGEVEVEEELSITRQSIGREETTMDTLVSIILYRALILIGIVF